MFSVRDTGQPDRKTRNQKQTNEAHVGLASQTGNCPSLHLLHE